MVAANRQLLREINRFKILHAIRDKGLIPRVDIARITGLSQASVTGITADLIKEKLLLEKEAGESLGGRRPILLGLNPNGAYAIGVYLSVTQISVAVIDLEATILASYTTTLPEKHYSPDLISEKIVRAIHACMWESNFSKDQLSGIGIGLPGLVDSQTGLVLFYPNYGWEKVNLRNMVQEKVNHATYIDNSANMLTVAEQWFGEGRSLENFILITLEQGVGLGIVINGQLYRGHRGTAGEFGHTTVDPEGPLCRCGSRGCLEAFVSNRAILREAEAAARRGEWRPENLDGITIDEVIEAARAGTPCLQEVYKKAGVVLGIGVSNLIGLFNPSKVILSGKGVEAGDLIFNAMYETIPRYIWNKINGHTDIVIKERDRLAYARGSGSLVLQEVYRSPTNRVVPII